MSIARLDVARTGFYVAAVAAGTLLLGCGGTSGQSAATSARTVHINDTVHTHVTSRESVAALSESGQLFGTLPGTLTMAANAVERRLTFKVATRSGAFEGYAVVANDTVSSSSAGTYVHTTDTAYVTHGSGMYVNVSSKQLTLSGGFIVTGNTAIYHLDGTIAY